MRHWHSGIAPPTLGLKWIHQLDYGEDYEPSLSLASSNVIWKLICYLFCLFFYVQLLLEFCVSASVDRECYIEDFHPFCCEGSECNIVLPPFQCSVRALICDCHALHDCRAANAASMLFERRLTQKQYVALVYGHLDASAIPTHPTETADGSEADLDGIRWKFKKSRQAVQYLPASAFFLGRAPCWLTVKVVHYEGWGNM